MMGGGCTAAQAGLMWGQTARLDCRGALLTKS